MKLLVAVDAPGPAEFIAPVIPLLQQKFDLSLVTVKESPSLILKNFNPIRCDSEAGVSELYSKISPDALLLGMSSLTQGPYVVERFAEAAHREGKLIIAFQDYWANHRWPMNFKMMKYWTAVLVPDALAEQFLRDDGYAGKIFVTGNPAFDRFRNENVGAERSRLRAKFNIHNSSFIILYSGTGTPQSETADKVTFALLAEAMCLLIHEGGAPILIARPHPRDEHPTRYQEYAPDLPHLDTSRVSLSDELLPMADAVVSMYATNLIHACYLRIPAVSILLPEAGRMRLAQIHLDDFPPTTVGASIGVYENNPRALADTFTRLQNDAEYRAVLLHAQTKFFHPESVPAFERVISAIIHLIGHR